MANIRYDKQQLLIYWSHSGNADPIQRPTTTDDLGYLVGSSWKGNEVLAECPGWTKEQGNERDDTPWME